MIVLEDRPPEIKDHARISCSVVTHERIGAGLGGYYLTQQANRLEALKIRKRPQHEYPIADSHSQRRGQDGRAHSLNQHRGCGRHRPENCDAADQLDRKSTRLNSSHRTISYAVFCLKKKKKI